MQLPEVTSGYGQLDFLYFRVLELPGFSAIPIIVHILCEKEKRGEPRRSSQRATQVRRQGCLATATLHIHRGLSYCDSC